MHACHSGEALASLRVRKGGREDARPTLAVPSLVRDESELLSQSERGKSWRKVKSVSEISSSLRVPVFGVRACLPASLPAPSSSTVAAMCVPCMNVCVCSLMQPGIDCPPAAAACARLSVCVCDCRQTASKLKAELLTHKLQVESRAEGRGEGGRQRRRQRRGN